MTALTADRVKQLFDYDSETGIFTRRVRAGRMPAGSVINHANQLGYITVMVDRKKYLAHRLAWLVTTGGWPDRCDHIDGNPSNNRISNLRDVSQAVNLQNQTAARSPSGFLGAHAKRGRFRARIGVAGKAHNLGTFDSPEEAHAAYVQAKRILHEGNTL